jgi:cytochrome d ubiquinol oxidase subunit II
MDLPLLFALVVAFCVAIYVLADGFDLGMGILFLVAPRNEDRDLMMESVAPLWDGNETWLVAGGTLLLAAFPPGYYVLLPAFYIAVVTMLFSLILRGVAFEFRFHADHFRPVWDWAFAGGSLLATLSQGFILGGFIQGVPVRDGIFAGGTFDFLSPLGLLCGLGLVGGYALLGAGWLIWKTTGPTQIFGREIGRAALIATMAMMGVVSLWTALTQPVIAERWFDGSFLFAQALLPIAALAAAVVLWQNLWGRREALPFVLGLVLFLCGFGGLAVSLWPYVVPRQITIWQAAGDLQSLRILGVGTMVILPIILAYLAHSYWTFRGKIVDGEAGYGASNHTPALARRPTAALRNDLHLS